MPTREVQVRPESRRFGSRLSTIADNAMRSVTVADLEAVIAEMEERCLLEGWKGRRPDPNVLVDAGVGVGFTMVDLTPDTMNLHDVNKHIILEKTAPFRCSFAELVAPGPRKPDCFVSHSWSGPVKAFVACLRQYVSDRGLPKDTSFWVRSLHCALPFAVLLSAGFNGSSQCPRRRSYLTLYRNLFSSCGSPPRRSAPTATTSMTLAPRWAGARRTRPSTRRSWAWQARSPSSMRAPTCLIAYGARPCALTPWRVGASFLTWRALPCDADVPARLLVAPRNDRRCVYEAFLALTQTSAPYDSYTPLPGARGAVGITSGTVVADEYRADGMPGGAVRNKARREARFPLEYVRLARSFDVRTAQASVDSDRVAILNEIAEEADVVNATVRAHYTAASLPLLLADASNDGGAPAKVADVEAAGGESVSADKLGDFLASLRASRLKALSVFIDHKLRVGEGACRQLVGDLPSTLRRLELAHMPPAALDALCAPRRGAVGGSAPPVCALTHLALRSCRLESASVALLSRALGSGPFVLRLLDLSNNLIDSHGASRLATMLSGARPQEGAAPTLEVLGLSQNFLGAACGRPLATALRSHPALRKLHLHYNRLTNDAVLAIATSLQSSCAHFELLTLTANWLDAPKLAPELEYVLPPRADGKTRFTGVTWTRQQRMHRLKALACAVFAFVTYYLYMSAFVWTANVVATHTAFFGYEQSAGVLSAATALMGSACGVAGVYILLFLLRDGRILQNKLFYELSSGWFWDYRELHAEAFTVFDRSMCALFLAIAFVSGIGIATFQYRVATGEIQDCGSGANCGGVLAKE